MLLATFLRQTSFTWFLNLLILCNLLLRYEMTPPAYQLCYKISPYSNFQMRHNSRPVKKPTLGIDKQRWKFFMFVASSGLFCFVLIIFCVLNNNTFKFFLKELIVRWVLNWLFLLLVIESCVCYPSSWVIGVIWKGLKSDVLCLFF